jgi:transposase
MEVLYRVCCGLDVHKKTVAACLRVPGPKGTRTEEIRTFGTTTRELLHLADWLTGAGCTHVAMESTGVYWRPVYQLLEGNFELLLVNAQHIKAVPGREDRRQGLPVDGPTVGARLAPRELRAARAHSRTP